MNIPNQAELERLERVMVKIMQIAQHLENARTDSQLNAQEFLTLEFLKQNGEMITGDITRLLGSKYVAQTTRTVKSLKKEDFPLITQRLNTHDQRKINVSSTPAGLQEAQMYFASRVHILLAMLPELQELLQEIDQDILEKSKPSSSKEEQVS